MKYLIIYNISRLEGGRKLNIEKICPICGQDNNCQSHERECWCYHIEVPKGILDLVPEDKIGKACICKSCIEKYKEGKLDENVCKR
mgnify:CR=1 FL=1